MNELDPGEEVIFNAARQFTDPEKRRRYLDLACEAKPALRQRIEELLGTAREADSFFGRNADFANKVFAPAVHLAPTQAEPSIESKPGDCIGRYKLLQKIGEGGCGVVYMAEQEEPVRRRVALKVIKLGMDTKSVIARFEAERQALALMDHPNIAKVLDAGATEASVGGSAGLKPAVSPIFNRQAPGSSREVAHAQGLQAESAAIQQTESPRYEFSAGRPYFVMELVRGVKITDLRCRVPRSAPWRFMGL